MRPLLLALLLTLGSFAAFGQAPDCQFTQTFTTTGYGVTVSNQAVANLGTQCVTWRLSYYADNMTALSIQVEGAPDSAGAPGTFAAVPTTACSSTQQPPCTLDGANPLTDANHATVAFRGYYAWMALHVTVFTPTGSPAKITARMYGYKGTSPAASVRSGGASGNFVPYTGATADLNMGPHAVITGGTGTTGAIDLTGGTSGNTVTVTVDDSTPAGTVKIPGVTGTVAYVSAPGTPGNCPEFAADGIGLADTGNPCGSGGLGGNPYLNPATPVPIVPANWSDFNMASCTRNNSGNFEQLISNATSGNNVCGRTIAFPAGAFTRTLAVIPLLSGTQYSTVGFGISDGTKVGTCAIQSNHAGDFTEYLTAAQCDNSTSCSANYSQNALHYRPFPYILFFRITDDGAGNVSCQYSADGTFFQTYWTDKDTTGAEGYMTPTELIYFVNSATSNTVSSMTIIGYQ